MSLWWSSCVRRKLGFPKKWLFLILNSVVRVVPRPRSLFHIAFGDEIAICGSRSYPRIRWIFPSFRWILTTRVAKFKKLCDEIRIFARDGMRQEFRHFEHLSFLPCYPENWNSNLARGITRRLVTDSRLSPVQSQCRHLAAIWRNQISRFRQVMHEVHGKTRD